MKKITLLFFILLVANLGYAQEDKKIKFGDVTVEDLLVKEYEIDKDAVAVVLYDKGEITFDGRSTGGIESQFTRHKRIHILKKSGFDYANHKEFLYTGTSDKDKMTSIEAFSYNIENGKVVKTELESNSIFEEKYDKYYTYKKFTMPNVKEGSIIEFKYRIKSVYNLTLPTWEFQTSIPTLWSELKTTFQEKVETSKSILTT